MKRSAGSNEYTSSNALRNVSMFHSPFQSLEGFSHRVRDECILKPIIVQALSLIVDVSVLESKVRASSGLLAALVLYGLTHMYGTYRYSIYIPCFPVPGVHQFPTVLYTETKAHLD